MSGTFREIHIGIVTDNDDPEKRGRLKVASASLVGIDGNLNPLEWPDFIEPVYPYLASSDDNVSNAGWFFVPDIGVAVELEVAVSGPHDETPGMTSIEAPDIRWRGCLHAHGVDGFPADFVGDDYPNVRGIQTKAGHHILFNDVKPEVRLLQVNADGNSFLSFDEKGSIILGTSKGHLIYLNQDDGEVMVSDGINGNAMVFTSSGWYITDGASNIISADGNQEIAIMSQGAILMNASGVTANVGEFAVLAFPSVFPGTGVIYDNTLGPSGSGGFSLNMARALTEINVKLAPFGGSPLATAMAVLLNAGVFTSPLLITEGQ